VTSFGVLGPLEASHRSGPVPLKGPRHRTVLARLLVARGRVVPVGALADDVWSGAPPAGALAAIRTFVADLRRALEPDRPPRAPAALLVTAPPGYALRAAPGSVDAWRFEAALAAPGRPAEAELAALDGALGLWRGPAYAEWAAEGWARAEIDRLDELRMLATERRGAALLALGRPAEAASDLRPHAAAHPLREEAWRLLALALYRAGRQGDALAALRQARAALVGELGVDPGPALRSLEADILAQAPALTPPAAVAARALSGREAELETPPVAVPTARVLFGREAELETLRAAAGDAARLGRTVAALVDGEAGAGKTALAEALAAQLAAAGWTIARGRAAEHDGAPADWPWARPGAADAGRFDPHRAAARLAAGAAPVLLVAEDLHRADEDALDVLVALAGAAAGPVLLLGTARDTDPPPPLTAALARLARFEPVRLHLGGLTEAATGALAAEVAGRALDPRTVRRVHRRCGGNPFFVREVARLLAAEGDAALRSVPAGVRDVIRHRVAQLPEGTRTVLRRAAVLGRDVDPELLAAVCQAPILDAVEEATAAGFLVDGVRFAHVLVRDTLYGDLSAPRRAAWHAAAGEALERLRAGDTADGDTEALAHHFAAAGTRATAGRAARYSAVAAGRAERRSNPHEAARLWRQALEAHERAGTAERDRLDAVLGLGRALAVTGRLGEARRLRAAAVDAAERLGEPEHVAAVLGAFDVPAIWPRNDDEALSARIATAADRALQRLGPAAAAPRARLLAALAMELRGATDDRGARAAAEAERLARAAGDPALLALALNARFLHAFGRTGMAPERAALGEQLVALAERHGLVTFEVLGHLIGLQAACALGEPATADAHAAAADRIAERFALPLVGVFTQWYAALRLATAARADEAEAAYRAADARLAGGAMPGVRDGLLGLALLSIDRYGPGDDLGPYEPWARPLLLVRAGASSAAAAALHALPPSPHDLLREARLCLAARAARALGDRAAAARIAGELRPAAAEESAGSGVLTFGPVAAALEDG
jgi:DNA-binding SARP family transcriptional activator